MIDANVNRMLREARDGRPITKAEAVQLLALPERSLEAATLRATANALSRERFGNSALIMGNIGVDMAPCDGDCGFCVFAKSHTQVAPSRMSTDEVVARCQRLAAGGAHGVILVTTNRLDFDWFAGLCRDARSRLPAGFAILANVGRLTASQLQELRDAGVSGMYHACRLREGIDTRMSSSDRFAAIERILESGLDWWTGCEPIGPEHTPEELAEQLWQGIDLPCTKHGAMERFPVPGSPLHDRGRSSELHLAQVVAVITLATIGQRSVKTIGMHAPSMASLHSGANLACAEAGEPDEQSVSEEPARGGGGFTTALWRQSSEITTADCRAMLLAAGFSHLMDTKGKPDLELQATACSYV